MAEPKKMTVKDLLAAKGQRTLAQIYVRNPKEASACETGGIDMIVTENSGDLAGIRKAAPNTFFTVGLLYGAHASIEEALREAYRLLSMGVDAIYCPQSVDYVAALANEAIPTIGHVGLIPYKATWFGGMKAVGKTAVEARKVYDSAKAHEDAGAIAVEVEVVPTEIASAISERLSILTVGMGAGSGCDAQYLFSTDVLGDNEGHIPRHAKVYRNHRLEYERLYQDSVAAFSEFARDVATGAYPEAGHSLKADPQELEAFLAAIT